MLRRRSTADCQDFNRHLIKVSVRSPKHVFIFISYRKRAFRWNVNFSCLVMTASWSKGEILWSGAETQSPGKSNDHRTEISLLRTSINLTPPLPPFLFLFLTTPPLSSSPHQQYLRLPRTHFQNVSAGECWGNIYRKGVVERLSECSGGVGRRGTMAG